ncbi:ABC transporter ATP-binding protein [Psychromarinibacter halotolerans]|uniref:ABC transporter ATP-binding protein n=1 Tax=Psychromarinibacter halotolerans TaxID=1775175 RepID=A0ABV7GZB2_9RHOB|nr:ABC transporter ATP-binding protein [Psychromarinibacter halotolerans]MDF0597621.1 ABC transporter ATP-binding protein [Psychromarinibacter halotolerans]
MASVEISALRKLYGDVVALSDINITIPSGSFYTLLGPSGCGKTTLLRTIAGFHSQNSGSIKVDGASIESLPAYRRDVGMVFQDYAIFPHLSVRDNVAFGLKQRKVGSADIARRVKDVLEVVQLGSFADRMPHELSGGQQQRVGLARAIVIEPKVLLMDEPLSNLDAKLRVDLRAELRRIQRELGITTIYVTHDQEEALAMSDTVCVMYGGVIQQATSPLEIYLKPANRFVASFVGANNFLSVGRDGGSAALRSGGADVSAMLPGSDAAVACAIRPEALRVVPGQAAADPASIAIPANLREVSFIGREMEVFATTETGETLKAVARPDPAVVDLPEGSPVTFTAPRSDLLFFEDNETGKRIA